MKTLKNIQLMALCILLHGVAFSQVKFEKVYGNVGYDYGYSVAQMYDTGYAVVGATSSFGSGGTDLYLLKTDKLGNIERQRTFGGINIDQGFSISSTADSGLIMAGYTNSFGHGGYDMYVVKTDKNCDSTWTRTYGGTNWDFAYSVEQTSDGGFIVAGSTYSFGNGSQDMYLVKLDQDGDTVWTKTYGWLNDEEIKNVKQTSDGGYIFTGNTKSFGDPDGDIIAVKTNNTGDTTWTFKYQTSLADNSTCILEENTGAGYIITGETYSTSLGFQGIIIRVGTAGNFLFSTPYPGSATTSQNDGLTSMTQTADGRFAMVGYTNTYGAGMSDFVFYLEQPIGTYVTALTFGGNKNDKAYCIKNTSDGGFIICGTALSYSSFEHIYLIKTDSLGTSTGTVGSFVTDIVQPDVNIDDIFLIYPNPATDAVFIQMTNQMETAGTIEITDAMGRIHYSEKISSINVNERIELTTSDLDDGLYLVNFFSSDKRSVKKLIIQKK